MQIWEIVLIGIGLSMDAFAVATCRGLEMKKFNAKYAFVIALFFGGFQALMPFLGWLVGLQFESYIQNFDHWIAFILLAFIGGKMVYDAFQKDDEEIAEFDKLHIGQLFLMAIATSIDALAVGVTFAFLGTDIVLPITIIGTITFALSFAGVVVGHLVGGKFKNKAEIIGGVILILIGVKILLEHLGVLVF